MQKNSINKKQKKSKKDFSYYATILFAFSFTLLIYGLVLNYTSSNKIFDPEKDVVVVKGEDEGYISIDSKNPEESSSSQETTNQSGNKNNKTQKKSKKENQQQESNTQTVQDDNNTLRNVIQNTYGITVKYGSETEGYSVGGLTTTPIYDSATISSALNMLKSALSLYPKGLFPEIRDGGIPLTVYLIENYSQQSVTGATDSNYSFAHISIAVAHPFDESFFHESYHYIERYIFKRGLTYNTLTWNGYNPPDFTYGTIINNYSYKNTFSENSYFVNNYAQVSAEEDRASTFEYMMAPSKASCLNYGKPVWQKAILMSNTIDAALVSVRPSVTEYWERHL